MIDGALINLNDQRSMCLLEFLGLIDLILNMKVSCEAACRVSRVEGLNV